MALEIRRMTTLDAGLEEALARLLPQLSGGLRAPSREVLGRLLAQPCAAQLAALDGERIVGVLTLVWYDVPSGRKGWVEDVVVDAGERGRGVGRLLVEKALELARSEGVQHLMLTSNPARRAAHALYRTCGFEEVGSTLFRFDMNKKVDL